MTYSRSASTSPLESPQIPGSSGFQGYPSTPPRKTPRTHAVPETPRKVRRTYTVDDRAFDLLPKMELAERQTSSSDQWGSHGSLSDNADVDADDPFLSRPIERKPKSCEGAKSTQQATSTEQAKSTERGWSRVGDNVEETPGNAPGTHRGESGGSSPTTTTSPSSALDGWSQDRLRMLSLTTSVGSPESPRYLASSPMAQIKEADDLESPDFGDVPEGSGFNLSEAARKILQLQSPETSRMPRLPEGLERLATAHERVEELLASRLGGLSAGHGSRIYNVAEVDEVLRHVAAVTKETPALVALSALARVWNDEGRPCSKVTLGDVYTKIVEGLGFIISRHSVTDRIYVGVYVKDGGDMQGWMEGAPSRRRHVVTRLAMHAQAGLSTIERLPGIELGYRTKLE